ncbi:MAG: transposase family protein [Psychromonas sp.]|nr:transposase family protein [Psychromonas sp.]
MSDFEEDNLQWLRKFTAFEHGAPSYHTISHVFSAIGKKAVRKLF